MNSEKFKSLEQRLNEVELYCRAPKFEAMRKKAVELFISEQYEVLEVELNRFPNSETLMEELIKKLQGKSVLDTLKRVINGKYDSGWTSLKGLTSLITHCLIECEKGNTEYMLLVHSMYERVGQLLSQMNTEVPKDIQLVEQGA